jgi:hypothetical protein
MSRSDDLLVTALQRLGPKPPDSADQSVKKRYSERMSEVIAAAFADELRARGLRGARPGGPGEVGASGAERRMAGGIGAKKVDVTYATEESGLVLAISVKSINFADGTTGNYQKNLTNRRGDMLFEAVTLHRRFPYAVLAGVFFFDEGAASDGTASRNSTFVNAHEAFRLFTHRDDPAGRDEQFERFYIVLHRPGTPVPSAQFFAAGDAQNPVPLDTIFDQLIALVAERNADLYELVKGQLKTR